MSINQILMMAKSYNRISAVYSTLSVGQKKVMEKDLLEAHKVLEETLEKHIGEIVKKEIKFAFKKFDEEIEKRVEKAVAKTISMATIK